MLMNCFDGGLKLSKLRSVNAQFFSLTALIMVAILIILVASSANNSLALIYASPPNLELYVSANGSATGFIYSNANAYESHLPQWIKIKKTSGGFKVIANASYGIGNYSGYLTLLNLLNTSTNNELDKENISTAGKDNSTKGYKNKLVEGFEALKVSVKIFIKNEGSEYKISSESCIIKNLEVADTLLGVDIKPLIVLENDGDYNLAQQLVLNIYDEDYNQVNQMESKVYNIRIPAHNLESVEPLIKNNLQPGTYFLEVSSESCGSKNQKFEVLKKIAKIKVVKLDVALSGAVSHLNKKTDNTKRETQNESMIIKALIFNNGTETVNARLWLIIPLGVDQRIERYKDIIIPARSEQVFPVVLNYQDLTPLIDTLKISNTDSSSIIKKIAVLRLEHRLGDRYIAQESSIDITKQIQELVELISKKTGAVQRNGFGEKPVNVDIRSNLNSFLKLIEIIIILVVIYLSLKKVFSKRYNRGGRKSNQMIAFSLILLLKMLVITSAIILASQDVVATKYNSSPTTFEDTNNIAINESMAYDQNSESFANITTSNSGNVAYYLYDTGSHSNNEDIKQLDLSFDIELDGIIDDNWSLEYSENAGSSWNTLINNDSNLSRQLLVFYDVTEYTDYDWTWNEIANDLKVRISIMVNNQPDNASIKLFETYAVVTVDDNGPNIQLLNPINNYNTTNSTLVFEYNVTDELSNINNCSLLIDNKINQTDNSVQEAVVQNFTLSFKDGCYNWSIQCYDDSTVYNSNVSEERGFYVDLLAPNITLLSPSNNSVWKHSYNITFNYSVSDTSPIANCSLFINGSRVKTSYDVARGVVQSFDYVLNNSNYNWSVECYDITNKSNTSLVFNLTVDVDLKPVVLSVIVPQSIDLTAGGVVDVYCNGTARDDDGSFEIATINATLYHETSQQSDHDSNNTHYTNSSCNFTTTNSYEVNYTCGFKLAFNALPGNWTCNITAFDIENGSGSNTNITRVNDLYAFNITPGFIDYGMLSPEDISSEKWVNVQNLGNKEIDIALWGYGSEKQDGYSLVCDYGNVSVDLERYSLQSGLDYYSMQSLTPNPDPLDNFNLKPKNNSFQGVKPVYWRIKMSKPVKGYCSGFVVVSMIAS